MFKKYKLMFSYMKTIKKALPKINEYFKINESNFEYKLQEIKLDNVYRLYTVLNFPTRTTKNLKTYGHMFLDNETSKFITDLNYQLKKYGLYELVALTRADRVGENNVLIVIEYQFKRISTVIRNMIFIILSLLTIISLFIFL